MTAFDTAWDLLKMGRIFRGGDSPDGAYWTHVPQMARNYALGGGWQSFRQPSNLYELDDPKINEAAMKDVWRNYLTDADDGHLGHIYGLDNMHSIRRRFDGTGKVEMFDFETEYDKALEQDMWDIDRPYDESKPLDQSTIDWLKTGNVGAFYHTPDTSSYKGGLDFLLDMAREKPPLPELSQAGSQARNILVERLMNTGLFDNSEELAKVFQRYISGMQGMGESWKNEPGHEDLMHDALEQAGIDWLGYIDKDPRGYPTLTDLRGRYDKIKDTSMIGSGYKNAAKEAGVSEIFECEECGELRNDRNFYDHNEDICGECEGAIFCPQCSEKWDYCTCEEDEDDEDW